MDEAELTKMVAKAVSDNSSNNNVGIIVFGAFYLINVLWTKLNDKNKDPEGEAHRESTRKKIAHIEERQSDIMENIEDIQSNQRSMKDDMHDIKLELRKVKGI